MAPPHKIALIEIGGSHDECLPTQIAILKKHGFQVHLILSATVHARAAKIDDDCHCSIVAEPSGPWSRFQVARKIVGLIKQHDPHSVVFNTAHGKTIRNVCLLAPADTRIVGILHAARKAISRSATQSIISRRVHHYLVLSDTIRDSLLQVRPALNVSSFYPVYQPGCESSSSPTRFQHGEPAADDLTICIPGPVHSGRRDYQGLFQRLGAGRLDHRVQFVLLGQCDDWQLVKRRIEDLGLADQFTLFKRFVEQEIFHRTLLHADAIMPLIHPSTPNFCLYRTLQTSGSFHLALAYRKPLLMHRAFDDVVDFQQAACFYAQEDLVPFLNRLAADRSALERKDQIFRNWDKLTLAYQAERYLAALGLKPNIL
jgi:hypothetical protein